MIPASSASSRPVHERAVEVTLALVDLGMDAECMSAGLLREALVRGAVTLDEIERRLGANVMRLAHDCQRLEKIPRRVGSYDDESAEKLRAFLLTFHDVRAVVVELAYRVDALRDADALPRHRAASLALETMQLYAPVAHALDAGRLCAELEDLSLKQLFPASYDALERWLRSEGPEDEAQLERARARLQERLEKDPSLKALLTRERRKKEEESEEESEEEEEEDAREEARTTSARETPGGSSSSSSRSYPFVRVTARRKSLFSTMRKVLRDGRAREDVHDLLGVRVIVSPEPGSPADGDDAEASRNQMAACYRAREIAHETFDVVPGRAKDYLARPKANGYRSLHSTLELPAEWGGDDEDEDEDADLGRLGGRLGPRPSDASYASDASSSDPSASSFGASSRRSPGGVRLARRRSASGSRPRCTRRRRWRRRAQLWGGFKEDPGAAEALASFAAANAAGSGFRGFIETGGVLAGARPTRTGVSDVRPDATGA